MSDSLDEYYKLVYGREPSSPVTSAKYMIKTKDGKFKGWLHTWSSEEDIRASDMPKKDQDKCIELGRKIDKLKKKQGWKV